MPDVEDPGDPEEEARSDRRADGHGQADLAAPGDPTLRLRKLRENERLQLPAGRACCRLEGLQRGRVGGLERLAPGDVGAATRAVHGDRGRVSLGPDEGRGLQATVPTRVHHPRVYGPRASPVGRCPDVEHLAAAPLAFSIRGASPNLPPRVCRRAPLGDSRHPLESCRGRAVAAVPGRVGRVARVVRVRGVVLDHDRGGVVRDGRMAQAWHGSPGSPSADEVRRVAERAPRQGPPQDRRSRSWARQGPLSRVTPPDRARSQEASRPLPCSAH